MPPDTAVLHLPSHGSPIASGQDALDLIGEAWGVGAECVCVPAGRFDPSFFDLSTGRAGEFVQKFVNYGVRLVVLGDISSYVAASNALRDFVRESNRGAHLWFLASSEELAERLAPVG